MTFAQLHKVIQDHVNVATKDQVLLKPESGHHKLVAVESLEDHIFAQNYGFRS